MSREFLQYLPPELAAVFDTPPTPNPGITQFETLIKMEAVKEEVRKTSNLYKVFGENMFGYLTIDKELNLQTPLFDVMEFTSIAEKIVKDFEMMKEAIKSGGDGLTVVKFNDKEANIRFDSAAVVAEINGIIKDVYETVKDIACRYSWRVSVMKISSDNTVAGIHEELKREGDHQQIYAPREDKQAIDAAHRMFSVINRHPVTAAYMHYYRATVKKTVLAKSLAAI